MSSKGERLVMKSEKVASSYVLIFICLLSPICLAQNLITAYMASPVAAIGADTDPGAPTAADPQRDTAAQPNPNKLKVVIYPIEAWAPIFGASFKIPDTPSTPGSGSGSTSSTLLNGMVNVRVQHPEVKMVR
jgi:hypothetical protein